MKKRRWLLASGVLLVIAVAFGWKAYSFAALRERIPGDYTTTCFDGKRSVVMRFAPNGSLWWEVDPPDPTKPVTLRRWRLCGRVLVLEEGAAASAPVSFIDSFATMFANPLMGTRSKCR